MSASLALVSQAPSLGDEIARLAAQIDAATHRLLTCIRAFDESGEWQTQGAQSCAHWLSWRIGLDLGTAREQVRVARALGRLPVINAALARAQLSYCKVRALTRVATPEIERRLMEYAGETTGAQLERICRRFRSARREIDGGLPSEDQRGVSVRPLGDGLVRLEVTLHPDEATLVLKAIERARDDLRACAETRPPSQDVSAEIPSAADTRTTRHPLPSRADAVVHLAEESLAAAPAPGRVGNQYQVFIHLDQSVLGSSGDLDAFLEDGTRVSAETFRRVSCDGALVGVATGDNGMPLDVGRRTRAIPPAIRRALLVRDGGCRWPGCTSRRFVHGHHIRHWVHGGPTSLSNLVTLCTFHHRLLHEGGFSLKRDSRNGLQFLDQRGEVIRDLPSSPALTQSSVDDTEDRCPPPRNWSGERIDYDAAVDALIVDVYP